MFNSNTLLTKPSTSLLMRHTDGQTKANPSGEHTQAHVPTHTNRHLSLLEVRGVKGLFVVLAPAPCSQSISPFRRSLSSRTATFAMIEWLSEWVQDHDSVCFSQWPCEKERESMAICVCVKSHISPFLWHPSPQIWSCPCLSPSQLPASHTDALYSETAVPTNTHQNAVRQQDKNRYKVIKTTTNKSYCMSSM